MSEQHNPEVGDLIEQERRALLDRDNRYAMMTGPMWLLSRVSPEKGRRLEAAYFFSRHIDDLLDGDRVIDGLDPDQLASSALAHINDAEVTVESDIFSLFDYAVAGYEGEDLADIGSKFSNLISVMQYDRMRSDTFSATGEYERMSRDELRRYYNVSIGNPISITLKLLGSSSTAEDMKGLPDVLGRMYSLRDFEKDMKSGICNVPHSKLGEYQRWFWEELSMASAELYEIRRTAPHNLDKSARRLLRLLSFGPSRYARKLSYPLSIDYNQQ